MSIERKLGICILVFTLIVFCLVTVPLVASMVNMYIVAILPDKTSESRLIRIIDRDAGIVCYVIQNDTADFYSGLQCLPIDQTYLERKKKGIF